MAFQLTLLATLFIQYCNRLTPHSFNCCIIEVLGFKLGYKLDIYTYFISRSGISMLLFHVNTVIVEQGIVNNKSNKENNSTDLPTFLVKNSREIIVTRAQFPSQ